MSRWREVARIRRCRRCGQSASLNPRPEAVTDEQFARSEFLDARDLVQVKYEMVRRARVEGEPVEPGGGGVRVLAPVVLCGAGGAGWGRAGGAGAGAARAQAGAQADRRRWSRSRASGWPRIRSCPRQALVELIAERFGVRVHRRSVERALARAERAEQWTRRGER